MRVGVRRPQRDSFSGCTILETRHPPRAVLAGGGELLQFTLNDAERGSGPPGGDVGEQRATPKTFRRPQKASPVKMCFKMIGGSPEMPGSLNAQAMGVVPRA